MPKAACVRGISRAMRPTSVLKIPGAPGKYFYVWLDAPIGYLSSFSNYCAQTGIAYDSYPQTNSQAELHHFIDIVNFHGLFLPAVLQTAVATARPRVCTSTATSRWMARR